MTLVWIVLGVLALMLSLFVLGWLNAIRASGVRNRKLESLTRPAMEAVRENGPSAQDLVTELAEVPATRNYLFARLTELGKADMFPLALRLIEKVAESDLARWLMHPNELGTAPAEMELVRRLAILGEGRSGSVFLFRFRAEPSSFASERGWMAGVAGPYWDDDESPGFASGTFSDLTPFDRLTVEQHVEFLRRASEKKGLVVPS
jgi:hypothetical protein